MHWVQAVTFLLLLLTGLAISLSSIEAVVGHRAILREIHLVTAFLFVFGPAVVALAGNFPSITEDAHEVESWSREDIAWIRSPKLEPDPLSPPPGRFNAGQKLNAVFTLYCVVAFGITGLILWQNRRFPFPIVSQANLIHQYLTYIALAVFLGHLYLSVIHPSTRRSLSGILSGGVDARWAAQHHPLWRPMPAVESRLQLQTALRSCVLLLLGLESALLLVRVGFEWLGANVTDPATKMIYRFSGLPGTLQHAATG
ncbi:MAG TPA: cytochrome b/b6 domain-containing protein, partial [Chloroflexota bacterium]|nr:cytochrome b/b6 domain-containing protein [Chloroflexota bacterium]